jgi:hypothetical protein
MLCSGQGVLELLEDPVNNHNCEIDTSDLGAAVCEADTIGAVLLRCVGTGEADLQLSVSLDTSNVVCDGELWNNTFGGTARQLLFLATLCEDWVYNEDTCSASRGNSSSGRPYCESFTFCDGGYMDMNVSCIGIVEGLKVTSVGQSQADGACIHLLKEPPEATESPPTPTSHPPGTELPPTDSMATSSPTDPAPTDPVATNPPPTDPTEDPRTDFPNDLPVSDVTSGVTVLSLVTKDLILFAAAVVVVV